MSVPGTVGVHNTGGGGRGNRRNKALFFFFTSLLFQFVVSAVDAAETGPSEGVPAREKQDDKDCFTSVVCFY